MGWSLPNGSFSLDLDVALLELCGAGFTMFVSSGWLDGGAWVVSGTGALVVWGDWVTGRGG